MTNVLFKLKSKIDENNIFCLNVYVSRKGRYMVPVSKMSTPWRKRLVRVAVIWLKYYRYGIKTTNQSINE